jgi:hypothetical protein
MDEIVRNLAPPLGLLAGAIVLHLWARGLHRREAAAGARRRAHPAE